MHKNWYDYPKFYDIAFGEPTMREADFIELICRTRSRVKVSRLLEPGCGSGRLLIELASRDYQMVGLDLSEPAINYVTRKAEKRNLSVEAHIADIADFSLDQKCDAAYCLGNTFRHFLTDHQARSHLLSIGKSIVDGGFYILSLNLLPSDKEYLWTERRGKTKVTVHQCVIGINDRIETVLVRMTARTSGVPIEIKDQIELRTYTIEQFRTLITQAGFTICYLLDHTYDINKPVNEDSVEYAVFVLRKQ